MMKKILLTMVFLAVVSMTSADSLVVPNASFELPNTASFVMEIDDWEHPGSTGVFSNTAGFGNLITNADGNQMVFMNCFAGGVGGDKNNIFIDLDHLLMAGTYTLTVGIAARSDSAPSDPANTVMEIKLFMRVPAVVVLASQEVYYSDLSNTALTYYSATFNAADIPVESMGSSVGIWLDSVAGNTGGDWTLDDITLTMVPMFATNPTPTDGQPNVGTPAVIEGQVDVQLGWDTGTDPNGVVNQDITTHYLYVVAAEPNFVDITPVEIPAGSPPAESASYSDTLDMDKTYFWRVDESINGSWPEDPNTIKGLVWSFETLKSTPAIITHPQNQQVIADETVEFSVEASSLSPMSYKWFVSVDNANDTIDDDIEVGTDSDTLTIINAQPVNEGYYYCQVNNDSGTPVASNTASLAINRMVAWYAFENDLTDSEDDNDGEPIKVDPNSPFDYIDGKVGRAIVLNGVDEAVLIPRSIQDGFTIALWVKTTAVGGDGGWWTGRGLVDGDMPGDLDDFGTCVSASRFGFGIGPDNTTISSVSDINDNQWYYCVATRDHVSGQMRVYVNGELETTAMGPIGRKDAPDSLRIGKIRSGTNYLDGQMDEVKLYNYPLSDLEIAKLYNGITDESVCLRSAQASLDLNDDCKVDLGDFAMLAGQWLDCALVPDCIQ